MDWPAYSPDLNPIEHVWDMLGRQNAACQPTPICLPELRRALLDEWCNIPQDQIDNLILSMPRRCKARIASEEEPSTLAHVLSVLTGASPGSSSALSLVLKLMTSEASPLKALTGGFPTRKRRPVGEDLATAESQVRKPQESYLDLPPTPCPSSEEYVTPTFARNYQGVWKYVVQIPQEGYFTQTVQQTKCIDEAHFWLNGYVNKQNCRIWSEANPQVYVETPLHPEKLTVWCALWAGGIIGPYFFKHDEGHNVTVNGDRYRAMITNFFIPDLNNHEVQELWFQQDGATCHTARATLDLLKDTFGDRLISRFGPVNWPPRSCDLTPLDYFLWGYVKSLVYADKPQTLDLLEDNIRRVIADIRPQMLENVIEN
ncbi:uncharacterized protein TNCV_2908561 [Trichonephila clavipes]|nr:uncharacterized protein TNCV_2908561 [Trichonephila clavipes]